MNRLSLPILITGAAVLILTAGCDSNKSLMLQSYFQQITVGQSDATEVLNLLPEEGMLHTAGAVSVFDKKGWSSETGIVQFSPTDSTVLRKDYVQHRSQSALLFTNEKLMVFIQSIIPEDVLEWLQH